MEVTGLLTNGDGCRVEPCGLPADRLTTGFGALWPVADDAAVWAKMPPIADTRMPSG